MSATTPTVCKVQLGKLLARLRDQAGMTQDEAGRLIGRKDRNKIVLVERAQRSITPGELHLLLAGYGVSRDDEMWELVNRLRDGSSQRGRWTGYRAVHDEAFRRYIDFEEDADLIRIAEVEVIPGLLQTEAYLRALLAGSGEQTGPSTDELVQARLARQAILTAENPPELRFVLSESCLRRKWGDNTVMREQLEHLIMCSEMPNVIIHVLPFEMRESEAQIEITYRFTVLRIPAPGLAGPLDVVYTELVTDLRFDDDKNMVAAHDALWTRLADSALNATESRTFLRSIVETYR
ncbi:helix-turn-helix domain-containing protein [Pseudonocardia acaciae]|uniref:helix-turn-helix domain-containing protein n=1 Tax=Pseudonocardia acaciae TaxID=551276 RepID=UPI00048D0899|nr:helix-turn-helix transcriptional regulator [Pseudonocardia acaciae]